MPYRRNAQGQLVWTPNSGVAVPGQIFPTTFAEASTYVAPQPSPYAGQFRPTTSGTVPITSAARDAIRPSSPTASSSTASAAASGVAGRGSAAQAPAVAAQPVTTGSTLTRSSDGLVSSRNGRRVDYYGNYARGRPIPPPVQDAGAAGFFPAAPSLGAAYGGFGSIIPGVGYAGAFAPQSYGIAPWPNLTPEQFVQSLNYYDAALPYFDLGERARQFDVNIAETMANNDLNALINSRQATGRGVFATRDIS